MALYDRFIDVMEGQPPLVRKAEARRNRCVFHRISGHLSGGTAPQKVVEVGVGTGAFARLCLDAGWAYTGIDRNTTFLSRLEGVRAVPAEVPPFPESLDRNHFDLAYSAFVLEHMRDGLEALQFIEGLTGLLRPGGHLVLLVPDSLSLGLEFWNLDYTHRFPTCERNVGEIALECGLELREFIRYRGPFVTGPLLGLLRLGALGFSYRLCGALFGHKRFFYGVYQYVNQEILMFVFRKPEVT